MEPYFIIPMMVLDLWGQCAVFWTHLPVCAGQRWPSLGMLTSGSQPSGMSSIPSAAVRVQLSQVALHVFGFLHTRFIAGKIANKCSDIYPLSVCCSFLPFPYYFAEWFPVFSLKKKMTLYCHPFPLVSLALKSKWFACGKGRMQLECSSLSTAALLGAVKIPKAILSDPSATAWIRLGKGCLC